MTRKEKAIQETKREIEKLKEKLTKIETLPDFSEDEELYDIEDFPVKGTCIIYLQNKGIRTLGDLVYSNPEVILSIPSCGKATLGKINEWLQKHNLSFVD